MSVSSAVALPAALGRSDQQRLSLAGNCAPPPWAAGVSPVRSPDLAADDAIRWPLVLTGHGVNLTGIADVTMGDVPWMKSKYELGRKRSRY